MDAHQRNGGAHSGAGHRSRPLLGLWGHWTASAQDTFIVNDDTVPAADGCDTPDFETEDIEDAVDSALVADGDTLVICEGTYNPPNTIEVAKAITIEGRAGADREDVLVQGIAGSDGLEIQTDGVTIRHLTLTGPVADIKGIRIMQRRRQQHHPRHGDIRLERRHLDRRCGR